MDIFTTLLPVLASVFYFVLIVVLVKLILLVYQLPKRLGVLEKRIKQLEDKEHK